MPRGKVDLLDLSSESGITEIDLGIINVDLLLNPWAFLPLLQVPPHLLGDPKRQEK